MSEQEGRLRSALRSRLLDGMIRKVGNAVDRWKVLVVDRAALRILAAALEVNKLVDEGITIVEMLDMRRQPLPRIPAIYFITPTAESVQHLAQEQSTQYKSFHLFFTARIPDFLMDVIRKNAALLRRVKTFIELDVQFLAVESRVFSLDRPAASLPQLYAEKGKEANEEMTIVSERLTETCKVLAPRVDWCVRYDATSYTSRTVASLVKEQLETARLELKVKDHEESKARQEAGSDAQKSSGDEDEHEHNITRATLLVVDRATDMASPLIHEFSYQAIAHDLLKLNYQKPGGAHIEIPDTNDASKTKTMQLEDEENDPVWNQIRSKFVEEALVEAQTEFKKFLETDVAFKIRGKESSEVDIKDMGAAVRALPESQMRADKHAMHINALKSCLSTCHDLKLNKLALVEQDLIIGRHSDGTKIPPDQMVEDILTTLGDESIPLEHRCRLLMLGFIVFEGLLGLGGENSALAYSNTFRLKLQRSGFETVAKVTRDMAMAVKGLQAVLLTAKTGLEAFQSKHKARRDGDETVASKLRQRYAQRQAHKHLKKVNAARRRRHDLEQEGSLHYDVARYHPPLRSVMMDIVDDELDKDAFPTAGAVSVDSIIASVREASIRSDAVDYKDHSLRSGSANIRAHSVAGMIKSVVRVDSGRSSFSDEDDGRFRLAEKGHLYIVFVVGGVCHSEVRSMYEVCTKREANIIIGGSQIVAPRTFVRYLGAVADPVERIRVMLPPLPLELAQSRAARARTLAAGAEQKERQEQIDSATGVGRRGDDLTPSEQRMKTFAEERSEAEVEVVTGYKKSKLRIFGRRKR
ncbi:Sec1-like protein [Gracilaria domingensis]|nr:Sec1-like protein [Gracilaria domingensis]